METGYSIRASEWIWVRQRGPWGWDCRITSEPGLLSPNFRMVLGPRRGLRDLRSLAAGVRQTGCALGNQGRLGGQEPETIVTAAPCRTSNTAVVTRTRGPSTVRNRTGFKIRLSAGKRTTKRYPTETASSGVCSASRPEFTPRSGTRLPLFRTDPQPSKGNESVVFDRGNPHIS